MANVERFAVETPTNTCKSSYNRPERKTGAAAPLADCGV